MSGLGSLFVYIGAELLRMVGFIFDKLIWVFLVNFRGTLDTYGMTSAITTVWTLFRNLANIVIIGMFTFIALCIILGLKEYGQKKLVANVLLVAIFLNFSLLATKMVIDFSNFTAYQFYCEIAANQGQGVTTGSNCSSQTPSQFDIASGFLNSMHVNGIVDSWTLVSGFASSTAQSTNSNIAAGIAALFFGIVASLLLVAAALVIGYGCFLIIERGLLLIFLMITSAIAFTTYLAPNLSKGKYGFSAWLRALVNTSIFAPLLMLFLWASNMLLKTGSNMIGTNAVDMGSIINDPSKINADWGTLFVYIMGIGFLYISFKVSSSVAASTGAISVSTLAKPLMGPGGTFGQFAYRNTVGRAASGYANNRVAESKRTMLQASQAEMKANEFKATNPERYKEEMARADQLKKKSATQAAGVFTRTVSALGKNYDDALKKRIEQGSKRAAVVIPKSEDIKQAREKASREKVSERQAGADDIKRLLETAKESARALTAEVDANRRNLAAETNAAETAKKQQERIEADIKQVRENAANQNPEYNQAKKELGDEQTNSAQKSVEHEKIMKNLNEEYSKATDQKDRDALKTKIEQTERERESEMRHESERIKQAQSKILDIEQSAQGVDVDAFAKKLSEARAEVESRNTRVAQLKDEVSQGDQRLQGINESITVYQQKYDTYQSDTASEAKKAGEAAGASYKNVAASTAGEIGKGTFIDRTTGVLDNEKVASGVRSAASHKMGEKSLAEKFSELAKQSSVAEGGGGDHH